MPSLAYTDGLQRIMIGELSIFNNRGVRYPGSALTVSWPTVDYTMDPYPTAKCALAWACLRAPGRPAGRRAAPVARAGPRLRALVLYSTSPQLARAPAQLLNLGSKLGGARTLQRA